MDMKGNCHNKLEYVEIGCDLHGNVHQKILKVTVYCVI